MSECANDASMRAIGEATLEFMDKFQCLGGAPFRHLREAHEDQSLVEQAIALLYFIEAGFDNSGPADASGHRSAPTENTNPETIHAAIRGISTLLNLTLLSHDLQKIREKCSDTTDRRLKTVRVPA